jgi:hypothetical protein
MTKVMSNGQAEVYSNPLIFDTENKVWIAWTQYNDNNNHKIVLLDQEKL